jgi:hypothetical protein
MTAVSDRRRLFLSAAVIAVTLVLGVFAAPDFAWAQAKLEAHYSATLSGLPIGEGTWVIDLAEDKFSATVIGATTGLIRIITGGRGDSSASGLRSEGQIISSRYSARIKTSRKTDEVLLTVDHGTVKDYWVIPPVDKDPDRVPVTDAERRNVLDPMSASLIHMSGNGKLLSPEACRRNISVFDGRMRYNLKLVFRRMDRVEADKGYAGPVVVCSIYFAPVAGFIPSRTAIKYLVAMRDAEIWLAPIVGTRILVPFRIEVPTPLGPGAIEATQFVVIPQPVKASIKGAKTD